MTSTEPSTQPITQPITQPSAEQQTRRPTRQQLAVQETMGRLEGFRSAQEIHEELRSGGDQVGLATVYRTLQRLADGGQVDRLLTEAGEALYRSCSGSHHHHLVCRSCGRTVEVEGPAVERWTRSIAEEHGFADVSHTLEIFGVCSSCR